MVIVLNRILRLTVIYTYAGWQPRWFVLSGVILAYYKTKEETDKGCKRSINLTACEINVHSFDQTRLDLIIPGGERFYVKASSVQERQKWLISLGSAKSNSGEMNKQDVNKNTLKSKHLELRLYCDALMQQIHKLKSTVTDENAVKCEELDQCANFLKITCDDFIRILEDIMKMIESNCRNIHAVQTSKHFLPPSVPIQLKDSSNR